MAHQDAVVVVVQVVPPQHVQLPPHRRHHVVNSPLQHGTAGQPLVLMGGGRGGRGRWRRRKGEESDADERKVRCGEGGWQKERG